VDLQGTPKEVGVAQNFEGKRRSELGFRCARGRESQREKEERIGREREDGRGSYPLIGASGGSAHLRRRSGDGRLATELVVAPEEEDRGQFYRNPPGFRVFFPGNLKTAQILQ
jgi:hypothetical protein